MVKRVAVAAMVLLLVAGVMAGEPLRSGPPVGKNLPGPFYPMNLTGEAAGKNSCLVCQNGLNPVAMIFARNINDPLTQLVKKIDTATAKNKDCQMGSFIVFLNDDEKFADRLKTLAEKEGVKHCTFAVDRPVGPTDYEVAKDADVTVVLYVKQIVKANHAFKKGELNEKAIERILNDVSKITAK